jgi:hypothetical protein
MALSVLGSATCSVLDYVRTELRTMLAIAKASAPTEPCNLANRSTELRSGRPLKDRHSQILGERVASKLGGSIIALSPMAIARTNRASSQGAGSHPIYPMRRAKETSELGRTIQCHSLSEALTLMLPPERT